MSNQSAELSLPDLHLLFIEIVAAMDRYSREGEMLTNTCLARERALFPLLVLIERLGPIGIAALGRQVRRDNTTVSRQVTRLQALGLADRRPVVRDQRVRAVCITTKGKAVVAAVESARRQSAREMLDFWDPHDVTELHRLLTMLKETISTLKSSPSPSARP